MSYDLYALDLPADLDVDEIGDLLDDESGVLTPRLHELLGALAVAYPGESDDDFDTSPWSSWPLDQPVAGGRGCAFNLRFSATDAIERVVTICWEHGLAVYDPQVDEILRPPAKERKRWFRG